VFLAAASIVGFATGDPGKACIFLAFAVGVAFSGHLDRWLIRRSLAKSPFRDDELTITFDEVGFHASSAKQDVKLRWEVFSRVAHFQDGVLLFQGPRTFNWIPFSAMAPGHAAKLDLLLREHIKQHKIVQAAAPATRERQA
jgi:hypothetical protein